MSTDAYSSDGFIGADAVCRTVKDRGGAVSPTIVNAKCPFDDPVGVRGATGKFHLGYGAKSVSSHSVTRPIAGYVFGLVLVGSISVLVHVDCRGAADISIRHVSRGVLGLWPC